MDVFEANRKGTFHLCLFVTFFSLMMFQAQLTVCQVERPLSRVIRSLDRPDNQMVGPVQLYETIFTPTVPFLGELSETLTVGKVIRINGYVSPSARRFDVNLCSDCYEGPMQFHISIRFNPKDIVANSYDGRKGWGAEDRSGTSGLFPLDLGSEFDIVIEVNQDNYNISIDGGRHVSWTYAHRMPFTDVNNIEIAGDVHIWEIEYTDKSHQSSANQLKGNTPSHSFSVFASLLIMQGLSLQWT